jgi:peptide/nickel transport system substrate-binding protein
LARRPVGTGPFKLKEHVRDERIVLEAFDGHWRGRPKIDEVIYRVIYESATRVAELLSGRVDLLAEVPPQDVSRIERAASLAIHKAPSAWTYLLTVRHGANPGDPPIVTSDKRNRQAMFYAINRRQLTRVFGGIPTLTQVNPPMFAANEKLYDVDPYDPAKARQLLTESGYLRNPRPVTIHVGLGPVGSKELGEALGDMLRAVGFEVNVDIKDQRTWREQIVNPAKNREAILQTRFNRTFHAWWAVGVQLTENDPRTRYNNPELRALARRALAAMEQNEQVRLFKVLQERMVDDVYNLPMFQNVWNVGTNRRLNWSYPADDFTWMFNAEVRE